jgi:hypothetical protein
MRNVLFRSCLQTSCDTLGTNRLPYKLIMKGNLEPVPWVVDVHSIAKAQVLTIELPRAQLEKKPFNSSMPLNTPGRMLLHMYYNA